MIKRFLFIFLLTFFMFSSSFSQESNNVQKFERHYFDSYSNLSSEDELARLDPFLISFNEYPEAKALIVLHLDKNANSRENINRIKEIFNYTKKRKFESYRMLFAIKKESDEKRTFLWQIFPDDSISDFVSQNSILIKGEEFEKDLKSAF